MKMTRKNTNAKKTQSLSTMGYLTMVLALVPGIAAFSGLQSKVLPRPGIENSSTESTGVLRRTRDTARHSEGTPTRLYYISGASNHEQAVNQQQLRQKGATWWNSIFGGEQSSAADDYLEFLDRRYNRLLHDEQRKPESKGFSVMNWLYQGTNGELEPTTQKQHEEDALYVLGVANLASKKFLQKHHLPSPEELASSSNHNTNTFKSKPADVTDVEIVESTSAPVAAVMTLFRQVALRRQLLIQRQTRSARLALAYTLRSLAATPKKASQALQKLFVMGGGKKSMALTFAAIVALSVMLRPLIGAAAREGANTIGP